MKKGLSDQAMQRLASLQREGADSEWGRANAGGSNIDESGAIDPDLEDSGEDEETMHEDAQFMYDSLKESLAQLMADRYHKKALPLLHEMVVTNAQSLWESASAEARMFED